MAVKKILSNAWQIIKDYIYNLTIGQMKGEMKQELLSYINDMDEILILAMIIGFLCMITGNKKLGTKITSFSILVYLISKAVLIAYVV